MTIPSLAILTRIREVIEDGAGSVRTVTASTFGPATHEALSALQDSLGAIGQPQAEARITGQRRHPSSPPRQGTFTLTEVDVQVRIVRGFDGYRDLNADSRTALWALASSQAFDVGEALGWPGNLPAATTGLVSGHLIDGEVAVPSIEFINGQSGRLVTTHKFTGVVRVTTPIA